MKPQSNQLAEPPVGPDALPSSDRLHILAAATEVFVGEGYRATTADQLRLQIFPDDFDSLFAGKEGEQIASGATIAVIKAPAGE